VRARAGLAAAGVLALALMPAPAVAQQPFVVDDAGVASRGLWHMAISNQADILRTAARPARWQNVLGGKSTTAWDAISTRP
jgi:hypothetical protein